MVCGQGGVLCGFGYPRVAFGGLGECVEPGDAVAGGGGQVGADDAEVSAPVMERMQPETLMRSLLILITRSASLLSNGTRRSRVNRG
jgi:hypothetical protein